MKVFTDYSKIGQWVICTAISEKYNLLEDANETAPEGLDVCITINGVEFDFENIAKAIEEQFDGQVEKRSKELAQKMLLNQKLNTNSLYDFLDKLENARMQIQEVINEIDFK